MYVWWQRFFSPHTQRGAFTWRHFVFLFSSDFRKRGIKTIPEITLKSSHVRQLSDRDNTGDSHTIITCTFRLEPVQKDARNKFKKMRLYRYCAEFRTGSLSVSPSPTPLVQAGTRPVICWIGPVKRLRGAKSEGFDKQWPLFSPGGAPLWNLCFYCGKVCVCVCVWERTGFKAIYGIKESHCSPNMLTQSGFICSHPQNNP